MKVKVFIKEKDKYVECLVKAVEDCKGFRGQYSYKKLTVILPDGGEQVFNEYDCIPVEELNAETLKAIDDSYKGKVKKVKSVDDLLDKKKKSAIIKS